MHPVIGRLIKSALLLAAVAALPVWGADPAPSRIQQMLTQAAEQQKYTFLLFFKEENAATKAMAQVVKEGIAKRKDRAVWADVQVTDPAEKAIVTRFDVSRAPMPLTLAVAPNGAITGIFSQKLDDTHLAAAFVTPTMTGCMTNPFV